MKKCFGRFQRMWVSYTIEFFSPITLLRVEIFLLLLSHSSYNVCLAFVFACLLFLYKRWMDFTVETKGDVCCCNNLLRQTSEDVNMNIVHLLNQLSCEFAYDFKIASPWQAWNVLFYAMQVHFMTLVTGACFP